MNFKDQTFFVISLMISVCLFTYYLSNLFTSRNSKLPTKLDLHFRWICIYPAYLNSAKTRAEGRLLAKDKCLHNPSAMEIRDVLVKLSFLKSKRKKSILYIGAVHK